ncbi:MAG: photosynthetic reaction center subunit H [Pseudomonadota bacterium]|jgi:photosynthetic reaction center H subunit
MGTGAITQYVDVAQLVLYMFWAFFFGLIYYLIREGHREGYPMETDGHARGTITGWPVPEPKTFLMADGSTVVVPDPNKKEPTISAEPNHSWIGAPLVPTGNPLLAGVGPGAYAQRADVPEPDEHGKPKIVPLRTAEGFGIARQDHDPRGMPVIGADGIAGGVVKDLWVDRMEMAFRFLEIEVPGAARNVLIPMLFVRIGRDSVKVEAVLGAQIAQAPVTRHPDLITMLEDEKISAFYGAGTLYATPDRAEALL